MSIGRITVDLLAKTGSFETDLNRAAKVAEKRAKEIDAAVSKAGNAIGASLAAAGAAAVYFGKQIVDGLDALNDVKDATGASIENISALEDVALRTGSSMENVSSILVKFNNVLKETDGKNAASEAIKAIGLDAEELKRIDPAEALRQTAVALSGFADDGNKARLVQELFGKSIKDAAPFLNDLAEQTSLVAKVTTEQAQAAETFNKELFAMQKNVVDVARDLAGPMVSAINEVIKAFREGQAAGKSFLEIGLDRYWSQVREFWGMAKANTGGATGSWGDAAPVAPKPSLPAISAAAKAPSAPKKAAESEFKRYLDNLEKQLQKTKELGVEETVLADIQAGRLGKINAGEKTRVVDLGKQIDAAKAMTEYTKLSESAEQARTDGLLKATLEQEKQAQSLADGNKALREETELLGKSYEAQVAIEQARISSAISIKQEELARLAGTDAFVRESDAIREQITLLTERKDLVAQKGVAEKLADEAKKSADFARDVGAAFESSFEKAILEGDKLSDVLKGLAKDILALYIRNSITGPLAKSIGDSAGGFDWGKAISGFAGLFGGARASGGPVAGGSTYLVGENGPEMFTPKTSGAIIPNHALGGGKGGDTYQYNFTVGDVATASMVREAVANSERRTANGFRRSRSYAGEAA